MEAFVIYLFLAAFVLASTALSWWGGYQMGCEEGTAPSVNDREDLYRGNPHLSIRIATSQACEQVCLLGGEFLFGQDSRIAQLAEFLELIHDVIRARGRCSRMFVGGLANAVGQLVRGRLYLVQDAVACGWCWYGRSDHFAALEAQDGIDDTVGVSVVDPHCDIAAAGGQDDHGVQALASALGHVGDRADGDDLAVFVAADSCGG